MRQLPPLAAVRVFEAAARHGNFTRAADELGMTQAAVSHQVKLLEDRVGGALFRRSARGVTLTELGAALAPAATAALDQIARAFAEAKGERAQTLGITAVVSMGTLWLAPRLGGFMAANPQLSVRLDTSNQMADFADGAVDVGIRSGLGPWPPLRADLLFRWYCSPMMAPEVLAAHGPVRHPSDLLRFPRAVADDEWWQTWFRSVGVTVGPADFPPSGLLLESQILEGTAALAGQGVAMLTPALWRRELRDGRLVQPFAASARFEGGYWLVYPEGALRLPKVRRFRDWLLAEVEADGAPA